jgi:hypothetical protein
MKKKLNAIENSKEDRSLILRRGRQTIRRATARLPKALKIPEPARNCQRRVKKRRVSVNERGYRPVSKLEKADRLPAGSGLLLLRHFPGDLFHELGPQIGQHALHDAGNVGGIVFQRGRGFPRNLLGARRYRPRSSLCRS